jgi:glycosyltransferase involved in cell wall biosynthesis
MSAAPARALMLTPDEGYLDRRIAQEAATLACRGWSVDIFPVVDSGLRYAGPLVKGVRLLSSPHPPAPEGSVRRALRASRRQVGRVAPWADRAMEALRYLRWDRARQLADASREHLLSLGPYGVVFAHDVPVFPLAVELAKRWESPLICDLHEIFPEQDEHFTTGTARRYWRSVESIGMSDADGIICVNAAVADYVRATYAPSVPIIVLHNTMPFMTREALIGRSIGDYYSIPAGSRVMIFAGSLRPYANLEMVIAGFGRANLEGWVLAILGDGPLKETLLREVKRLGLRDRIFLGARADERDLVPVIASADVGLLPYQAVGINHAIATPNKLFEYLQARVPIATSRLPMIERIMEEARTGGYVDYSSTEAAADGLRAFVRRTLPDIMPDALDAAAERFAWEREEGGLVDLVQAVTRRPAR